MDRREKRRKFHQAIIEMLYPPPTRHHQLAEEEEDPASAPSVFVLNQTKDPESFDCPSSSSSDDDEEGEPGPHKLTRAQRKKLRKKKLKESTSSSPQPRKIIGPLLPSALNKPDGDNAKFGEDHCQGVRQNAAENQPQNTPPEECNAQKVGKLKRRRMAKREKIRPSHLLHGYDKDSDSAKQ